MQPGCLELAYKPKKSFIDMLRLRKSVGWHLMNSCSCVLRTRQKNFKRNVVVSWVSSFTVTAALHTSMLGAYWKTQVHVLWWNKDRDPNKRLELEQGDTTQVLANVGYRYRQHAGDDLKREDTALSHQFHSMIAHNERCSGIDMMWFDRAWNETSQKWCW